MGELALVASLMSSGLWSPSLLRYATSASLPIIYIAP
jgi:hypothetical protein